MEKGKGTSESASFRTPPSSWIRSEGEMPAENAAEEVKQMESQHRDGAGSLEKAVEKEMVEFLLQQNRQLQEELEKVKAQRGPSTVGTSWSEVSVQPATPSTPRAVGQKSSEGEGRFRFTPGGTQVPPDSPCPRPPPLPPVPAPPPMDFRYYEMVEEENSKKARMEMGVRQWQPQEMQLDNPFWQSPVQRWGSLGMSKEDTAKCLSQAGEALNRRQVLPDTAWRRDLDREQQLQDRAWQVKDCQDGRAPHGAWPEVCQSDRAQHAISPELPLWHRAPHGADPEVCQGDRAQHAGSFNVPLWHRVPHGADRGVCQEGRAFEQHHQGRCDVPVVSYHGDQEGHQQLPCREGSDPKEENRDRERSPQEALRSSNPELPKLPEPGQRNSSVDAADWLVEIRPVISDISTRAGRWWSATMESTMKVYQEWLTADPLTRLRLLPPQPIRDSALGNPQIIERLEQRITTILLPALPLELRRDLVANRQLWPGAVVFRVLRTYQPGGWGEKSSILQELTTPGQASSPAEASSRLRMWKRQRVRAEELGATLPDVMLQVKALDSVVQKVMSSHHQVSFRVSTFRMNHNLDSNPSQASLLQFLELLTAEMDSLMSATPVSSPDTINPLSTSPNPKTKALTASPGRDKIDLPCKYWGTMNGCRHGKSCRFQHKELEDKHTRCWHCSATTHQRAECPFYNHPGPGPQDGGSDGGGKSKDSGKDGGKRGDGKSKTNNKGKNGKGGKPNATTNNVMEGRGKGPQNNAGEDKGKGGDEKSPPSVAKEQAVGSEVQPQQDQPQHATGETSALEQEITSLLRSLRTEATIRAYSLQKVIPGDGRKARVLIDGGATHCLRTIVDEKEWMKAEEIKVMLAEGETTMRQVAATKTLITREAVQAIIPMSLVTAVGYRVHWTDGQCRISHPGRPDLPVELEQGCPTIPSDVGMQLFQEVEKLQRQRCQVRAILAGEEAGQTARHVQLQELKELFPEVPLHLLQRVPGGATWDASKLPFNRRRRRQLESARHLVVYAFSGPNEAEWKKYETDQRAVLCLDSLLGVNLLDENMAAWLEHLLQTRDVDLWLSSPPCKTVSVCRQDDGGPPPLRSDDSLERFGLRNLSSYHRGIADDDTILWLRNLYWMWLAHRKNKKLQALVEQPRDPSEWCFKFKGQDEGESKPPSFLRWPETKKIQKELKLKAIHFEQGALGHPRPKPTTVLSSVPETWCLQDLRCSRMQGQVHPWPTDIQEKIKMSQSLAAWAPGFKQLLGKVVAATGLSAATQPGMQKLSASELEELKAWEDHVRAGHTPYRKDCSICIESRGRDRPHHRQKTVDGFCLSLDISGPYEPGFDQHVDKPRYYITAVVTVPILGDNPLVEGLRNLGMKQRETPPMAPNNGCGGSSSMAIAGQNTQEETDFDFDLGLDDTAQIRAARRAPPRTVDEADPFEAKEPSARECQELSQAEVQECDLMDRKWREHMLDRPRVEVSNLTQTLPLRSRHAKDVVQAVGLVYARLKSLSIPITRVHHDRAKEFLSSDFKRWLAARDLWQSTTAGDEPQTNGRVEAELNVVRGLARTYLKSASLPNSYWPLAIRAASESRFRTQLRGFGLQVPDIIPFGCRAMAQQKRWHRTSDWQSPNQMVTLLGPAADMTITSGGYFAELPNGRFIRTTAIVVPKFTSKKNEVQSMQIKPPERVNPEHEEEQRQGEADELSPLWEEDQQLDAQRGEEEKHLPEGELQDVVTHLEVDILPDVPPRQQPEPSAVPRRKIIGKQTVIPYAHRSPALLRFALGAGGECPSDDCPHDEEVQEVHQDQWNLQKTLQEECEVEKMWMLFQHQILGEVIQEMASFVMEDGGQEYEGDLIRKLHKERNGLEAQLKMIQTVEEEVQREVLQTKTVAMQDLRNDPEPWYEPFKDEYDNLVRTVIKPLNGEQTKEIIKNSEKVERVPGKVVATIKPPFKRRGRIVACGNFMASTSDFETAASAIDTISVRAVLRLAADRHWQVSSTDIRKAFLNAPRLEKPKCVTLVDPPQFLRDLQVVAKDETWQVTGALYGFSESPRDWGLHRDRMLAKKRWKVDKTMFYLRETKERHLWELKSQTDGEGVVSRGYVCIYVDDILVTADPLAANSFLDALQTVWECSPPETATVEKAMKFCGYEIQVLPEGGLKLGQPSFVQELINKHNVEGEENTAAPKIENPPDEDYDIQTLRMAQAFTGELQWLQSRTRPDLCYIVGCLSRWLHKKPGYVITLAKHTLRYLKKTKDYWLHYEPAKNDDWGEDQVLHRPRTMGQLEVYIDTSFGLEHEQGRSVQGVLLEQAGAALMWTSGRQPFIAASTGEAELLGYSEGHQEAESVGSLLGELGMDVNYVMYGDCRAALSLASTDSGTWRTRHLRLRAYRLRESLRYSNVPHDS